MTSLWSGGWHRITIRATIENADGSSPPQVIQVGEVKRDADVDPASGLGLFVREANALLLCALRRDNEVERAAPCIVDQEGRAR